MTFIHDIIKINMVKEGFLPNYPPHLISDDEMCDAFLKYPTDDTKTSDELWEQFLDDDSMSWFKWYYPLVNPGLEGAYREFIENLGYHLNAFKSSDNPNRRLPDWIYSYMLNAVISTDSSKLDIHDMLVLMDVDNIDDIFTPEAQARCYETSSMWLRKMLPAERDHRSPALFGEPHVLKSLRLDSLSMVQGGR